MQLYLKRCTTVLKTVTQLQKSINERSNNITKIKKPDLRRSLGVVLQDTHLFTGTVMDNIRYGRLDATDAEGKILSAVYRQDRIAIRQPENKQPHTAEGKP